MNRIKRIWIRNTVQILKYISFVHQHLIRWKRRYPILNKMGEDLTNAKETIDCTAILHNISMIWGDEVPPLEEGEEDHHPDGDAEEEEGDDPDTNNPDYLIVEDNAPR